MPLVEEVLLVEEVPLVEDGPVDKESLLSLSARLTLRSCGRSDQDSLLGTASPQIHGEGEERSQVKGGL